ncbi:unnamed protein product [Agarophyton chilense]
MFSDQPRPRMNFHRFSAPTPLMSAALRIVSVHTRHSILYLLWAVLYVFLVLLEPAINAMVVCTDWLWLKWPWSDLRLMIIAGAKRILTACSPALAEHCLSRSLLRRYIGTDRSLLPSEKKQLPLHSVSLNGCAWQLPYHIGVCEVLKGEKVVDHNTVWLGSSGGALIAAAAVLDLDLQFQLKFCISMGIESVERHTLGPLGTVSNYTLPHIFRSLPKDAHVKATDRLFISVTETPQKAKVFGNAIVGKFRSKAHLHSMLAASTYIPIYYERPVRPGIGRFYWDGGFSNNQPVLHDDCGRIVTTTVNPSAMTADICPPTDLQETCNIEHLFPCGHDQAMRLYEQGRRDAANYVKSLRAHHAC